MLMSMWIYYAKYRVKQSSIAIAFSSSFKVSLLSYEGTNACAFVSINWDLDKPHYKESFNSDAFIIFLPGVNASALVKNGVANSDIP